MILQSDNLYDALPTILSKLSIKELANVLGIHPGTIKRWQLLKAVPHQYLFDFARILDIPIDYTEYSFKQKDQFFTDSDLAAYCLQRACDVLTSYDIDLNEYIFVEPSAGNGSFFNLLPTDRRLGFDIEPKASNIQQQDFIKWIPTVNKAIVIGNPPFGLRGHLALQFFEKAKEFADFVCFILPPLFDSNGKGSCKSRINGFNLIHSEKLSPAFHYPDGVAVNVNAVFQIWSKDIQIEEPIIDLSRDVKIVSLSDGGTPATTRNKDLHNSCDFYLPSTVFGKEAMRLYDTFQALPQKRGYGIILLYDETKPTLLQIINETDWSEVAFVSTNNAYNLRSDLIIKFLHTSLQYAV